MSFLAQFVVINNKTCPLLSLFDVIILFILLFDKVFNYYLKAYVLKLVHMVWLAQVDAPTINLPYNYFFTFYFSLNFFLWISPLCFFTDRFLLAVEVWLSKL